MEGLRLLLASHMRSITENNDRMVWGGQVDSYAKQVNDRLSEMKKGT
jgi:hypothetical protein